MTIDIEISLIESKLVDCHHKLVSRARFYSQQFDILARQLEENDPRAKSPFSSASTQNASDIEGKLEELRAVYEHYQSLLRVKQNIESK